jgi:hypothetical protein
MGWFKRRRSAVELEDEIMAAVDLAIGRAAGNTVDRIAHLNRLEDDVLRLREEVANLELTKLQRTEEFDRREREIEHKVGLERARQTQELTLAKREALVGVREENLATERKVFEGHMSFYKEQMDKQVDYLKEMIDGLSKRLPSAKILARIGEVHSE